MPTPLADRMRPKSLSEVVGQDHLLKPGRLLDPERVGSSLPSLIFWGPPGSGKTTLALLLAERAGASFVHFSAVLSGVAEVRRVVAEAKRELERTGKATVLFVDEIHRFNKSQQDAFLPHVESGLLTLLGATTENPSFEIIPALLSRARVVVLKPLGDEALGLILERALADGERGLGGLELSLTDEAREHLIAAAQGDGRALLNALESAAALVGPGGTIDLEAAEEAVGRRALIYDKTGEGHYNTISAFHKALRGSDPDAALYWLARMLIAGEDPLYVARRMVRAASEDVGNADPRALSLALDAMEAYRFLGSPEGELALAQAAVYIACAPKSNALYTAWKKVSATVEATGSLPVPMHIRNAPTRLMKDVGYAQGYKYPHDYEAAVVEQDYLPEKLAGSKFYHPTDRGYEKRINERLAYWKEVLRLRREGTD